MRISLHSAHPPELLFHTEPVYASDLWRYLVENRQRFISEVMIRQYLGFVRVCIVHFHVRC